MMIVLLLMCLSTPIWAGTGNSERTDVLLTEAVLDTASTDSVQEPASGLEPFFMDNGSFRMDLLGYGVLRNPVEESILNRGNWLDISTWQTVVSVRPDVDLDVNRFHFSIKPRWSLVHQTWTRGVQDGDSDTSEDFFVNEWMARLMVTEALFISYGRENLQWGPAFLISPSNPFIKDNGRDNPKTEVGGLTYARLLWIPYASWSASFIANIDDGAHTFFNPFYKKYAVKIDYTGFEKYGSVIFSHEESGHDLVGFLRDGLFPMPCCFTGKPVPE